MLNQVISAAEFDGAVISEFSETLNIAQAVRPASRLRKILREPMVHFVLAGALIFAVAHSIEQAQIVSARTIVVDSAITTRLSKLYELQLGAAPTPTQLKQLIDTYIHDEVLYREALALGLDKGDEIVRRRLVQKMGFLLSDAAPATELDDTALRAYYNANKAEFARPAQFTLTQLYFGDDASDGLQRAKDARVRLQHDSAATVSGVIDTSFLTSRYLNKNRDELSRTFGATPLLQQLDSLPAGTWSEPVRSGYGWHLLRIDQRIDRAIPPYDSVRNQVADAAGNRQRALDNARNFAALRANYDVRQQAE